MASPPFFAYEWNRPVEEYCWSIEERQPFRAIVKDLVRNKPNFSNIARMREDLDTLQSMGVLVQDIEKNNYCNGKLVDFSLCWTSPHVLASVKIRPEKDIRDEMIAVQCDFDRMLETDGVYARVRALTKPGNGDYNDDGDLVESIETDDNVRAATASRLRRITKKPDRLGFSKTG